MTAKEITDELVELRQSVVYGDIGNPPAIIALLDLVIELSMHNEARMARELDSGEV